MLSAGATLQNRYHILRQLGQGGMGAVYEATDGRFGTPVALKEIVFATTDARQREYMAAAFEREAKALATIQHECIPFVRDYFSEEECEYLVMELIPGDDLAKVLEQQKKPFSIYETLSWLQQLLDSLDYLHNLSPPIFHRDIKPQNLKVTARKRLKLLDFGIAKSGTRSAVTTRKQTFIGATLDYSPFEQILRVIDASFREFIILKHNDKVQAVLTHETDERADIFSAGAAFYHLLTNRVPEDATKRTLAVWEGQPDPLPHPSDVRPDISRPLGDFLLKAMAVAREDRFHSAAEMLEALNRAALAKAEPVIPVEKPNDFSMAETITTPPPEKTLVLPANLTPPPISFHTDRTAAFTISNENALKPTENVAREPENTAKNEESNVKGTENLFPAGTTPKQSMLETVALPAGTLQPMLPAPRRKTTWIVAAVVLGFVVVVIGGVATAWFGGLFGTSSPTANNTRTENDRSRQSPTAAPSPTGQIVAATPAPTVSEPANLKATDTRADNPKSRQPVTKSPQPVAAPAQKPKQKPKAAQDLNCIYTNSCK